MASGPDSSDEEGQAFYVGGSEHSGQQVVGPQKSKKPAKFIQNLFDSARAHGAEPVSGGAEGSSQNALRTFKGTGYKLGETTDDTEVIPDQTGGGGGNRPTVELVLKLWKNGFSISGEGVHEELRSYSDPSNAKLLNAIAKGEVPQELVALANGGKVNMDMEDHREQDFAPPKKTLKAFSGTGQTLGVPSPAVLQQQQQSASSASAASSNRDLPSVTLDESQPVTTVQIRLADGSRKVQKFNHTHTVGDIRQFVSQLPGFEGVTFQLQTNFPVKTLADDSQSVKEAQLLNATIIQRLV